MRDKQGNKLTTKEYMKRWGEGIEGITPQQKLDTQLTGTKITLIGIFLGLCVSLYGYKNLQWVALILCGAFITTWVQYISFRQQKRIFKQLDLESEEVDEEEIMIDLSGEEKKGMSSMGLNFKKYVEDKR